MPVRPDCHKIVEPAAPVFARDDPVSVRRFRKMILDYYRDHGRDLAWRRTTDPYHILVSEIMLQQTQVDRVIQRYPVFIATFPDFRSLADAPLPDVLAAWQGMGYNRRAIALRNCAVRVMEEFGGILPDDVDILTTFPGIGRATASSICAFAFNRPVVFIETNIRRIFIHCFFEDEDDVADYRILPLVSETLYRDDPRTWYNALMDFGTNLKTMVPNPNRRSRHYVKQAAFEGSDRKIRGAILRRVLAEPGQDEHGLIQTMAIEPGRGSRIISSLIAEGLIMRENRIIYPGQ